MSTEARVGVARVRHGDAPAQGRVFGELRIDGGIDARDEEGGDTGDRVEGVARIEAPFEAGDIGSGDALVDGHAEEERDVHIDAVGDQLGQRLDTGGGAGHLDHHVRAIDQPEEALRFGDGRFTVVLDAGRHLEGDVAVDGAGRLVDGTEGIGGELDILGGESDEGVVGVGLAHADDRLESLLIVARLGDGLVEDGRVGGHARDAAVGDHTVDLTGTEEPAADVVEPDALAVLDELLRREGHVSLRQARLRGCARRGRRRAPRWPQQ